MNPPGDKCAICMSEAAIMALVPCGHRSTCKPCCDRICAQSNPTCPICRARITSAITVHDAGIPDSDERAPPAAAASADAVVVAAKPESAQRAPLGLSVSSIAGPNANELIVCVRVESPENVSMRLGVDIAIAIDVSGSMSEDATYEDAGGNVRRDGLSVLDIARHAIRVVAASLTAGDRLAIVSFNRTAHTTFPLTAMNEAGRVAASAAADSLRADGGTNIWGGLAAAMDLLRAGSSDADRAGREQCVLLLTDGVPNVVPPAPQHPSADGKGHKPTVAQAHVAAFTAYKAAHPNFHCSVRTFGFGYSLDSELLVELARAGGGTFAFVPVAPVMGTTFVHSVSNALTMRTCSASLHLVAAGGASFILGGAPSEHVLLLGRMEAALERWGLLVHAGPVQVGQPRDVVLRMKVPDSAPDGPRLLATLHVKGGQRATHRADLAEGTASSAADCEVAILRCTVADTIDAMVHAAETGEAGLAQAHRHLAELVRKLKESQYSDDERVVAMLKDLVMRAGTVEGRVHKALDGMERFKRWGRHYMRALCRAYELQQCTNQQDFGLQGFGGALFKVLRTRGAALFLALPPPSPQQPQCPYCQATVSRANIEAHVARCSGEGGGRASPVAVAAAPAAPAAPAAAPAPCSPARVPTPEPVVCAANYTMDGGGCFGGASLVNVMRMAGSSRTLCSTPISCVKRGDALEVEGGESRTVVCVVRSAMLLTAGIVSIPGGPLLTSHHPIRMNGAWCVPEGLGPVVPAGSVVYNLVLDRAPHIVMADGWPCVTLGHGLEEAAVKHAFYGTQRCIEALKALPGWEAGLVDVASTLRDKDGHASGFTAGRAPAP